VFLRSSVETAAYPHEPDSRAAAAQPLSFQARMRKKRKGDVRRKGELL
jgi:hypothetical protein